MRYRRSDVAGGCYFFTVNLMDRQSGLLVQHIDDFRFAFNNVKSQHPLSLLAMVVLPDHLHAVWRLPDGDRDFALRWSLIKSGFSRRVPRTEQISESRNRKRERSIWQRRYWEHCIRDENDLARHIEYIHYNPVKHGLVSRAVDWPHSTIHGYIDRGDIPHDWGSSVNDIDSNIGERR